MKLNIPVRKTKQELVKTQKKLIIYYYCNNYFLILTMVI